MLALAFVTCAMLIGGYALSRWLSHRDGTDAETSELERATSTFVLTFAIWTTCNWALALGHAWRKLPVLVAAGAVLAAGIYVLVKLRRPGRGVPSEQRSDLRRSAFVALVLGPLGMWIAFVLWRSSFVPVLDHDGLSYHMPKAILLLREGGYRYFSEVNDVRVAAFPTNFEYLLSTIVMMTGSDSLTGWPSLLAYGWLLISSTAVAERMWGRGLHLLTVPLLVGSAPVALLHCGAHKNDLLQTALLVSAFLTLGRWYATGRFAPAFLTVVALGLAAGTKFSAPFPCAVVACIAIGHFVLRREQASRFTRAEWIALATTIVVGSLTLGGLTYFINLRMTGTLTGPPGQTATPNGYGEWSNLWQFTSMLLMRPFAPTPDTVWNPFYGEYWWWPKYDLYCSEYGRVITILVLVLPFTVFRYLRRSRYDGNAAERFALALAFIGTLAVMLPIRAVPHGLFNAYGRYVLFIVPLVIAWTAVPVVRELLAGRPWKRAAGLAALVGCAATFSVTAVDMARHDDFVPLSFVWFAYQNPHVRVIPGDPSRACDVVDKLAAQDDHVAVDGDYGAYLYPVFGAELRRRITFIPDGKGAAAIPADARWVIVDRTWNKYWSNPGMTNIGLFHRYFRRGTPSPEDELVLRQLEHDPAFRIVHLDEINQQAVFERLAPPKSD